MRILILGCKDYPAFTTPWVQSGGMEVYAERMVRSLADRGRFTLYTAGGASDVAARVTAVGAARGLRRQPLSLVFNTWRRARSASPDADVLNPQTPLSALAARSLWRRFGIPYVVTVHAFGADPAHAGGRWAASAYSRIERLVFRDAAAIICTGRRLGAALRARYEEAADKVSVVTAAGEGVRRAAPRERTRADLGILPDEEILLFLGRLVDENGLPDLVAAFARLRERRPRACLLIAGEGDRRGDVAARVRAQGLARSVRWLGALCGQRKLDVIACADWLVRTSRHEVFPEAYVEALSVGTPVAATPAGDTLDLARASGAIALLPMGDPLGQAQTLAALLEDPARRAAMRARALDYSQRVVWSGRKEQYWGVLEHAAVEERA